MSSSNSYGSSQSNQQPHSQHQMGSQHDEYSSQQMPYSISQYAPQPGTYQTLSTTTQGYQQHQLGSTYPGSHNASYSGTTVPYPALHQGSVHRPVGGQQYTAHGGSQPAPGSQYVGHHQQAAYATAQYPYPQPQSNPPSLPPHSSRYTPNPAPGVQADRHGRRSSVTSIHQIQSSPSPELERYSCSKCDKTFSRAHDRKRHYETQHSTNPPIHKCGYCRKEFSRNDSLKRHLDNGCDKDPAFAGPSA